MTIEEAAERLDAHLAANAPADVAKVLLALAGASIGIARRIRRGSLDGALDADVGPAHDGVAQKALDVFADEAFLEALSGAGVRGVVSEEREAPVALDDGGTLLVAIDPLDGSSNIDADGVVGSVFSVLDAPAGALEAGSFLQPGNRQRAAGLFLFGPHVAFAFTVGAGVIFATLDPDAEVYRVTRQGARIPAESGEFAINAANARRWPAPVRAYVERPRRGGRGPARAQLQHALDRLDGRRGLPHSHSRRRLSLSGGFPRRLRAAGACGCSTRRAPSPFSSSRRAGRRSTAIAAFWRSSRNRRTSARR